ncbi:MAG: DOMON domain-containing protein [Cytophagales bacterium]|nr:DOMON domain-containing protein [Cytophagales bacterium]
MRLLILALFTAPFFLPEQRGPVHVGGMHMSYEITNDSVTISLSAPTTGWVGIGFNQENNILESDLLLFHVIEGKASGLDLFVKGIGDPRKDTDLNGHTSFRMLEGKEENGQTEVQFRIALDSQDPNDYQHTLSESFWLILAYSAHDDFEHHSLMRRHVPFVFEPK